jgi:hypothetical protein
MSGDLVKSLSPTTSPATDTAPRARVRRILDETVGRDLTSWERYTFLPSVANRFALTENMEKVLAGIERRLFGGDDA